MIVESLKEWKALCKLFLQEDYISFDVETYGVLPKHGKALHKKAALIKNCARIHTISVACSFGSFAVGTDKLDPSLGHLPASEVIRAMKPVLESRKVLKIIHNASYDVGVCSWHNITVRNYVCTLLMGAIQDANLKKGLKERSFQIGMYQHKMDTMKDLEEFLNYADEDAVAALRLYEAYEFGKLSDMEFCPTKPEEIEALKMDKWQRYFVYKQELPVLEVMLRAEKRGILIDTEYLKGLEVVATEKRNECLTEVFSHANQVFNINSGPQLTNFLYNDLGLKCEHFTNKGAPSADKKALFYLQEKHPAVKALIRYRSIDTLIKSYINLNTGIAAYTDKHGIVHCSINTHQAVTGRFSVTNPALQTIPREHTVQSVLGTEHSIRRAFIARPGYVIASLDYSQIELRLIAMYSEEKEMIRVLNEGGDLHQLTADLCGVTRQVAKACNFGLCYGMGPWKLADYLTMNGIPTTESQAKEIYEAYHAAYPGIKRFHAACVNEHKAKGYVTCLTGRRRHIPELTSKVKKEFSAGKRTVVNNRIQASAGDMLKQAIIRIDEHEDTEAMDIHCLLQVHDELIFEFPETIADECLNHVQTQMQIHPSRLARPITVPIIAEGSYGRSWADAK